MLCSQRQDWMTNTTLQQSTNISSNTSTVDMDTEQVNSIEQLNNLLDEKGEDKSGECLFCCGEGTFEAGSADTLLKCTKCQDVAIHVNCMKSFSVTWICPVCALF